MVATCSVGGHLLAPGQYPGGEDLGPPSEGGYDEVVETSDQTADKQCLGSLASGLAADQYLSGGGSLGEGVFAVLLLYEIFAERNQQQDTEHSSDERAEEYLGEIHREFRISVLQDVQGREGEYRSCHYYTGAGADGLDDDILAQGVLALECAGESYRYYRYRYGGLEDLPYFQSEESCEQRR